MFTVDLHAHTRFFHGFQAEPTPYDPIGARLLALWGRRAGLDGIALTNHDYYRPFDSATGGPQFHPGYRSHDDGRPPLGRRTGSAASDDSR